MKIFLLALVVGVLMCADANAQLFKKRFGSPQVSSACPNGVCPAPAPKPQFATPVRSTVAAVVAVQPVRSAVRGVYESVSEVRGYGSTGYGSVGSQVGYGSTGSQAGYGSVGSQQTGYGSVGSQVGYGSSGSRIFRRPRVSRIAYQSVGYGSNGSAVGYGSTGSQVSYGSVGSQVSYGSVGSVIVQPVKEVPAPVTAKASCPCSDKCECYPKCECNESNKQVFIRKEDFEPMPLI
jgi:hypothetical protein